MLYMLCTDKYIWCMCWVHMSVHGVYVVCIYMYIYILYVLRTYEYTCCICCVQMSIRGYSHKQHILLQKIMDKMTMNEIDAQRFNIIKENVSALTRVLCRASSWVLVAHRKIFVCP